VVLTFDDQHISVYENALPLMQEYGFRGTSFVNSANLGSQNLMTWDHVRQMELDFNWETGGHTLHHEQLNQLSLEEAKASILNDKLSLLNNGLQPESFALPRGQCPSQLYSFLMDLYPNIRGSSDFAMFKPLNRKALGYLAFQTGWNAEVVKHRIIRGIASGESLIIIGFHRFDAEDEGYTDSCTSEVFRDILEFLKHNQLEVLPLKEAVKAVLH
jgi:hypothetical protein